jgi:hypothetical protein
MRAVNRFASGLLGLVLIVVGLVVAIEAGLIAAGRRPAGLPLDGWYQRLTATTLANRAVLVTAIVVGVVGLLILVSQLRRWAPDRLLVGTPAGSTSLNLARGGSGPVETRVSATERDGEAGTVSAEASATSFGMIPDEPVMVTRDQSAGLPAGRTDEGAPWWVTRRSVQRRTATAAGSVHGVARAHTAVRGRPSQWRVRVRADGPTDRLDAVRRAIRSELDRLDAPSDTAVEVSLRPTRGRVR